jgi:hypothetical protein
MLPITAREEASRMFEDLDAATIGGRRPSRETMNDIRGRYVCT